MWAPLMETRRAGVGVADVMAAELKRLKSRVQVPLICFLKTHKKRLKIGKHGHITWEGGQHDENESG